MMIWDEEVLTQLKTLAASGLSASQIANELGCSRNSVIGKCRRTGVQLLHYSLKGEDWFKARGRPENKNPRQAYAKTPRLKLNSVFSPGPALKHRERALLLPESIVPCDILHLNDTTCRWPLWGSACPDIRDQFYCGAYPAEGSAWCEAHKQMSKRAPLPPRGTPVYAPKRSGLSL